VCCCCCFAFSTSIFWRMTRILFESFPFISLSAPRRSECSLRRAVGTPSDLRSTTQSTAANAASTSPWCSGRLRCRVGLNEDLLFVAPHKRCLFKGILYAGGSAGWVKLTICSFLHDCPLRWGRRCCGNNLVCCCCCFAFSTSIFWRMTRILFESFPFISLSAPRLSECSLRRAVGTPSDLRFTTQSTAANAPSD
jgi:hypothetical protein